MSMNAVILLAIRISRRSKVIDVFVLIEELFTQYPRPNHLRMDHNPEFMALAQQE